MAHIHLITGGQRSGKSRYAQQLALEQNTHPVYLATSRRWDAGHSARIARHQKDRGPQWTTIEEEKHISNHNFTGKVVVMDCVTLWLTNFLFDLESDIDKALESAKAEFEKLITQDFQLLIITNEIGMGGHPTNELQMKFTDLQGWMNQHIAGRAQRVTLMVSGLPLCIK